MSDFFDRLASPVTIELGALLRDFQLGIVLIAGGGSDTATRPVQWVHSSDLSDPSPFLTPRTVLLTTGSQFGDGLTAEQAGTYVSRLVSAGVTALGIGVGLQWDRVPPDLVTACDALHLPLLRVAYDTPFIAIVRAAARLISAETHAIEISSRGERAIRARSVDDATRALRSSVLELLLAGETVLAERVASPVLPRLPRGQVVALQHTGEASTASRVSDTAGVLAANLSHAHVTSTTPFGADARDLHVIIAEADRVGEIRASFSAAALPLGVSEKGMLSDVRTLVDQAGRALELARVAARPVAYSPAMHAGVIQALSGRPEIRRSADGLLGPLRQHDARHGDTLESALAVWLKHHGQTSPAAAELGVHRHTLRNRVATAGSLLGRNLDDPDVRADLWVALRLSQG